MKLILYRDGILVDHPPFDADSDFYYSAGKIGIRAQEGWTFAQDILDEGPDLLPIVSAVVHWSVEAAPDPVNDEPLSAEEVRAAMPTLSPIQFRKMLRGQGIIAAMVEAEIAGIADEDLRVDASDAWEYATFFERLNPLIDMIGALLGLTPEQIDAAWLGAVDA